MKNVEYFKWLVPSTKPRGKPRLTTYHMSREDAAKSHPGAVPAESTRLVRQVFESRDEAQAANGNFGAAIAAAGGGASS